MPKITIPESGMQFGEYNKSDVFQIEKSIQYTSKLMASGIKISEFLLLKNDKLFILEAKKSCPNYSVCHTTKEKEVKYLEYINSISAKFKNSLNLYVNIFLDQYDKKGVSTKFRSLNFSNTDIIFILVVKDAEMTWLIHYQDILKKLLHDEIKIFKIKDLLVINESTARTKHLII